MQGRAIQPNLYFLIASLVIGLAFTGVTPPATAGFLGITLHGLHWIVQSMGLMLTLILLQSALYKFSWFRHKISPWHKCIFVGFLAPWAFAPIGVISDIVFTYEALPSSWFLAYFDEIGGMTFPVAIVWIGLQTPFLLGFDLVRTSDKAKNHTEKEHQHDQPLATNTLSPFHELLPCSADNVIAMSSELHYISVMAENSTHLILYSLKQAIEELRSTGIQCHRSHWVSLEALVFFKQEGRQGSVTLINGQTLPVSRSRVQDVKNCIAQKMEGKLG